MIMFWKIFVLGLFSSGFADKADDQLPDWRDSNPNRAREIATNQVGCPYASLTGSQSVGPRGPILLADSNMITHLAQFNRERIPERVVHAKGAGAFGYFEVTANITHLTKAKVFSSIGKKTDIFVRLSNSVGEIGSADTEQGPRGMACKFYSEEGNWDLVTSLIEPFFIRDPIFFPSLVHSKKRNPRTNLLDWNMFWDFFAQRPEGTFAHMAFLSPIGLPANMRHMTGYSAHAFRMVNSDGDSNFIKFYMEPDAGFKSLTLEQAQQIRAVDPDFNIRDLYNAIAEKKYPSWKMYIQVMSPTQALRHPQNPFDSTKIWMRDEYPYIQVGKITLTESPTNHFEQVKQAAFSPGNLVPGIEPSPDKVLQGRIFAYPDTQRHRLGPNFALLPPNRPKNQVRSFVRDGPACSLEPEIRDYPNYYPNSYGGPEVKIGSRQNPYPVWGAIVDRYDTGDDDNFSQPTWFWNQLSSDDKKYLIKSIALTLVTCERSVQLATMNVFNQVNPDMGPRIQRYMDRMKNTDNEIGIV